jgi:hypothetical protein
MRADNNIPSKNFDLIVVGAGPAGVALTLKMLKLGHSVALVAGGEITKFDFNKKLYVESDIDLAKHELLTENRVRGGGGTSEKWGGRLVEFSKSDFEKNNSLTGAQWPIIKSDLTNYYNESLNFFKIGDRRDKLIAELDLNKDEVCELLGFPSISDSGNRRNVSEFSPSVENPEIWSEVGNVFETYRKTLLAFPKFRLFENWHMTEILLTETNAKVSRILIKNSTLDQQYLVGQFYALACGAIENSRQLLLLSNKFPNCLKETRKFIGISYSTHIFITIPEIRMPRNYVWNFRKIRSGLLRIRLQSRNLGEHGNFASYFAYPPAKNSSSISRIRILNFIQKYGLRAIYNRELLRRTILKLRTLASKVEDETITENFDFQCLHVQLEHVSNSDSCIKLGKNSDVFGNLLPNATLSLSDSDFQNARFAEEFFQNCFSSGLIKTGIFEERIRSGFRFPNSHAHQLGGTIMGRSSENSVVDSFGQVHEIHNLYISGSSVFTTAGEANPTHTIVALAIRTSEEIARRLQ